MVEQILDSINVSYKLIDDDKGMKLIKVHAQLHLLYLFDKGNLFLLERDFFDYIDGNTIPYSILCHDTSANKFYYLKLNRNANWVKSCFATCDKDAIFLGKEVLKAQISEDLLRKEFLKYK